MAVAHAFEDIEHRGAEHAGVDGIGLAGFEPDFHSVFRAGLADQADQAVAVVEGLGDPVAAAHVEIGELRRAKEVAELFIDRDEGLFEVVGVLLAEGVEVQAGQAGEIGARELVGGDAEAGACDAGIVERGGTGGALGIDPQAAVELAVFKPRVRHDDVAEAEPLGQRVEVEVVGEFAELADFLFLIGGRVGDDVFAEVVAGEHGFPQAGGAAAVEMVAEMGEGLPAGEAFQREDDLAARGIGGFAEQGGVATERGDGDDEGGHGERRKCQGGKCQVPNFGEW